MCMILLGSAKAKKMDESRASTPSKDANTSLSGTNAVGAGGTSSGSSTGTPVAASSIAAAAASTKYDSSVSSSTTASISTTATAVSRGNRKSIQSATTVTTRPTTPSSAAGGADKKDEGAAAENTEDELPVPAPPKSKRSEQQRASSTGNGSDASTASTTMSNQQEKQPPATATTIATATSATTTTTAATTATATTNVSTAAANPSAVPTDAPSVESEEVYTAKLEVKIKIPDELKHYLTDDWYAVVREHKLLELPAKVTVQQIADQYLAYKKSVKSTNASKEVAINDVLDGIIEYFNVMLGSQLLYKFERTQYADIMQKYPDTPLSELYGSFHLLRLFVRLGSMLSYSALDQPAMQTLLAHLHDFLKFLVKNSAMYFSMTNFINVDPEYVRNAQ